MSGRLVILPHKSWNVWNQDNREKVMRDERIHREAEEAKVEKDKLLVQEQNLELLRGDNSAKSNNSDPVDSTVVPFRLFEDLEQSHFAKLGNEDFLKEKAAKELAQKKRDGIADWALGEGSYECSKSKPWYAQQQGGSSFVDPPSSSAGPFLKNSEITAQGRECIRKNNADPMGSILVPNKHEYLPQHHTILPEYPPIETNESKEGGYEEKEDEVAHSIERHHKKHKRRKLDTETSIKHSKKKKHEKETKPERNTSINTNTNTNTSQKDDKWAELRQKRLERELVEKKRAALLLASADIYGNSYSNNRNNSSSEGGYSQQYHPHLARNYKYS